MQKTFISLCIFACFCFKATPCLPFERGRLLCRDKTKMSRFLVIVSLIWLTMVLSYALKMLEYGRAHFELQPNTGQLIEKFNADDEELSFEELLAQEKKDSFWYSQ